MFDKLCDKTNHCDIDNNRKQYNHNDLPPILGNSIPMAHNPNTSWKKKAIGLALIYLAPIALKYVRKKLEEYQRNRTTSSLEQLI